MCLIVSSMLIAYFILYFCQRLLLYYPSKITPYRSSYHAQSMKKVSFITEDGIKLSAWYKKARAKKATILYFHGNAGHWGHRYASIKNYLKQGYGILLFSYRGYGGNLGSPTEQGLYLDAQAANNYLTSQGARCVIYYGESLGTGVATDLALKYPAKGIILQSPYTSITALAKYHYPWSLLEPWDKFNSLKKIEQLNQSSLLLLHGKQDQLIPYSHSLNLYNKAVGNKQVRLYSDKNHNNMRGKQIEQDVNAFLSQVSNQCFLTDRSIN